MVISPRKPSPETQRHTRHQDRNHSRTRESIIAKIPLTYLPAWNGCGARGHARYQTMTEGATRKPAVPRARAASLRAAGTPLGVPPPRVTPSTKLTSAARSFMRETGFCSCYRSNRREHTRLYPDWMHGCGARQHARVSKFECARHSGTRRAVRTGQPPRAASSPPEGSLHHHASTSRHATRGPAAARHLMRETRLCSRARRRAQPPA